MTEESAVKVCVRVRPLVPGKETETTEPVQLFWKADKKSIYNTDDGSSNRSFSFDRVFSAEETTIQLYQAIAKPLVVSTVEGYNGTVFAYGQTSSGKTFTMMGSDRNPGVIPLAVEDVFQTIKNNPKKEFLLRVSYMEIYNETVTDLLVDSWKRKPLEVRETINKNICVADLTEELVTTSAQALAWIRKGEKNRHYAKTKMNQRSSRSHAIFRMILESRERTDPASGDIADGAIIVSHLNLVDLAGSERASQTGAEGARFKEGCNINRSLFMLGQVIKKLTDESQKGFTNYRDSKLTRILQNSLGGNAKTVIICTITPTTLEETLSTLQFASTAKKMKNDPHVTEVSDDGALLKRYRNEIIELKQRLQEVSSVTQTTATEKEVLSQLLQEKDQLQREQEDRIRNLTKLLVTSSNLVPVLKLPKRRVTWGGKMLKLAHPSTFHDDDGMSGMSFVDPFSQKGKAHISCLSELGEVDESFGPQWGIQEEPCFEMETSESSVTTRSFEDRSRECVSPDQMCELSEKVSSLEVQLEAEVQQREEAIKKAELLDSTVAELQLQLQSEAQEKQQAFEKIQMAEQRVADLERQLQEQSHVGSKQMSREFAETIQLCETLASEKDEVIAERDYLKKELGIFMEHTQHLELEKASLSQELNEKRELDEFESLEEKFDMERESELKKEICSLKKAMKLSEIQCLELQNKLQTMSDELKKKTDLAEDLQKMSGKDLVQEVATLRRSLDDAEGISRDTKKEWAILRSENVALEEQNVTLTAKQEKMESEMNSLLYQLETEKSRYKKMQRDLQKELNVAFEENTKLSTLLDGNVPQTLIDNVELERTVVRLKKELTASHEAQEALRSELETLASLQTLPDQVESLTKQLCDLTEELQAVKNQRDNLISGQTQCEQEAQQLRNSLQTSKDEILRVQADLSVSAQREEELKQQSANVTQQLDSLRSDLEQSEAERSQLVTFLEERDVKLKQLNEALECEQAEKKTLLSEQDASVQNSAEETDNLLSTITSLSSERDQLRTDLQSYMEKTTETDVLLQSLQQELRDQKQKNSDMMQMLEQKECELREQIVRTSHELQSVQDEKAALQTSGAENSTEEVERLLSDVASLTEERDQLKVDLQENIEMMIENQEELRTALEKNREQAKQIKLLESEKANETNGHLSDVGSQLEELQQKIRTLTEELESVRAERDAVIFEQESNAHSEQMEELLCRLTSLSEERDQLQETLEGLREEKQQLREELEDRIQMLSQTQSKPDHVETVSRELQADDERLTQLQQEAAETQTVLCSLQMQLEEQNQKYTDMQRINQEEHARLEQQLSDGKRLLQSLQEELETKLELVKCYQQKESDYEQQVKILTVELADTRAERDALMLENEANSPSAQEEELLCRLTSLSEERDQLQETLEGLREEKKQLREELEDRIQMMQCEFQQHLTFEPQTDKQETHQLQIEELKEMLENAKEEMNRLRFDLQENVKQMTEKQEELKESQEKRRVLEEELTALKHHVIELERIQNNSIEANGTMESLESKNQRLMEELESMQAERHILMSEKEADREIHAEEMKELLSRVTSLSEEKDQLMEEKTQLREELEERRETLQAEIEKLNMSLLTLAEQNRQLEEDLQQHVEKVSSTQELLKVVQDELHEQRNLNSDLKKLSHDNESLNQKINDLVKDLRSVEAERNCLLSEKELNNQTHSEQMEELLCRATSLSEERDQLQETLEGLREEKQQLKDELEDRMQMISALQEKFTQQQAEQDENQALLQQKIKHLEKQLQVQTEQLACAKAEADTLQQLLNEAKPVISSLKQQRDSMEDIRGVETMVSSQLHDSTSLLQESFGKFQEFIETCRKYNSTTLDEALRVQCSLKPTLLTTLPKATVNAYESVYQLGLQTVLNFRRVREELSLRAVKYRKVFEVLVNKDLAIFEEKRHQDLLLSRENAPMYSVKDVDFRLLWEQRLGALLDKRQLYLQKMGQILEKLWDGMASYLAEEKSEIQQRQTFMVQLEKTISIKPSSFSELDHILKQEAGRRSTTAQNSKMSLQSIMNEQNSVFAELKQLDAESEIHLREEKSKRSTLLQALEGAPLKTEVSLLKDNQQLVLQLQQAEENIKALHVQIEELKEAQTEADNSVCQHRKATQLLQTELLDTRTLVQEKDDTIQTLRSKLRESEKRASPNAAELEKLHNKLFQMEVKLTSVSDQHKQEIETINTVLSEKEESLRKMKEALRKSQQQGEESFLQGKDLYARLTNPKGVVIKSSVVLEKIKLEEKVQQLQLKITELESLVSSQLAEITKWKNRAVKLKGKSKAEVDKTSPSTPTKRGPPLIPDPDNFLSSPKKILMSSKKMLDSPKKVLESPQIDSPKSRYFDPTGSSDFLSRSRPKQFFDNSNLGTIPGLDVGAEAKEECWPRSPKQEEMCNTQ